MISEKYTDAGKFLWKRKGKHFSNSEIYQMVLSWYGGKCDWCGIDDFRVLTIDHTYPKGHRNRLADKLNHYILAKWIIRNVVYGDEEKKAFRVLCRNCNWLARLNLQEKPVEFVGE